MHFLRKLIANEKGLSQIQVFLVLIIPIVIILSLMTMLGEYWYRTTALDNANKQFVATLCKKGSEGIDTTINNYIQNLNSLLGADNYNIALEGEINNIPFSETSLDFLLGTTIGRNNSRQDVIGVYVESKKEALLSNIINLSIGWFSYTGTNSSIKYSSYYEGEVEPWLD